VLRDRILEMLGDPASEAAANGGGAERPADPGMPVGGAPDYRLRPRFFPPFRAK